MQTALDNDAKSIHIQSLRFRAAKCEKCGAKMYPAGLLEPHLNRHRRRERWFKSEVSKLRDTITRMRDFGEER